MLLPGGERGGRPGRRPRGGAAPRARLAQGAGEDGEDLGAVDLGAGGGHGQAAVGVAVVGDAQV
ncbi:hypothetical protein ACE14D_26990, partial [Streptomyces sp. Act-28]